MKPIKIFILVLAISMAVASCSKDDEVSNSVSGNKYGTTYMKGTSGGALLFEYKTQAELEANDAYQIIEFKTDGKFYVDALQEGTWTQSGSTVTVTQDTDVTSGTIDGNVLKISTSWVEGTMTVNVEMQFTKI